MIAVSFLFGACLNPISFNEEDLPRIKVEVEGTIKIDDVAVMWLINRTKSVDVTRFEITRPKLTSETEAQYIYPKVYTGKPTRGTSLATYHNPLEAPYTVTIEWDDGGTPGTWTKEVQFPRAVDYKFYLYRTAANKAIVINEDDIREVEDPGDTDPGTGNPSTANAQTFVVINVTPDQNVDEVEFVKEQDHFVISQEPNAKDQKMILLGTGSYVTTAKYTKGGSQVSTTQKNIVVTKEDGSMAVRTNFVYFYKTNKGDYQLSQTWPPIPNDASNENKPEEALLEGQGMLRIINKATPGVFSNIVRIKIDTEEHPSATNTVPYMIPGDTRSYILDAGTVHVSFMAQNQNIYGLVIPRDIHSRQVTTLEYTGDLANPDVIPPDEGYGAGLIRITNNSQGLVYGAGIFARLDTSKFVSYGYEDFTPAQIISYNQVGRISVIGTPEFPLLAGGLQVIQVYLETLQGDVVTVERLASIHGTITNIVISEEDLVQTKRVGSLVTVANSTTTPTVITAIEVYNKDNTEVRMVYPLHNITPSGSEQVYVLSGTGFPITPEGLYRAKLTVLVDGAFASITKDFSPDGALYSENPAGNTRSVTLVEADLAPYLNFKPVTGITIPSASEKVFSYTTNGNTITVPGILNFSNVQLEFTPPDATIKSPVTWAEVSDPQNLVSIVNNVLTVTGIPGGSVSQNGSVSTTITVSLTIPGAGNGRGDYSKNFTLTLDYEDITLITSKPATDIVITQPGAIQIGESLNLPALVTISPSGAHISGVPVTPANVTWTAVPSDTAVISGGNFMATAAGIYTLTATLPGTYTGGQPIVKTVSVTVNPLPTPTTLALRIILVNKLDSLKQIAAVPYTDAYLANQTSSHTGTSTIYSTGYTAIPWAEGFSYDPTYTSLDRFAKRWPDALYRTLDLKKGEWNYRDVTVPWPATEKGYYLFFLEGDNRARGYCYPGDKTAPAKKENFLFYLRADALTPIWLDADNYERAPNTPGAVPVIPISYHTDNNVSSIMKSAGIGKRPTFIATFK
jgi:hypothetical protein